MAKYIHVVKKQDNGTYSIGADTTSQLQEGETAHVAFVGTAALGSQKSLFKDNNGNEKYAQIMLLCFTYIDGRLKDHSFVQKVTISDSEKGGLAKYRKAVEKATGSPKTFGISDVGYIVKITGNDKNPIWDKDKGWSISKRDAGVPERMEFTEDTDVIFLTLNGDPRPDAEIIADYHLMCQWSPFFAKDLELAQEWVTSDLNRILNKIV